MNMTSVAMSGASGVSLLWGWYLILVAFVFMAAILSSVYYKDRHTRW
jgi:hypothetical protein